MSVCELRDIAGLRDGVRASNLPSSVTVHNGTQVTAARIPQGFWSH